VEVFKYCSSPPKTLAAAKEKYGKTAYGKFCVLVSSYICRECFWFEAAYDLAFVKLREKTNDSSSNLIA
jgi:hypothetical protein